MRIAVVNEVSTCLKNTDVVEAFRKTGNEVFNAGMTEPSGNPELTYLQTGLISALIIHLDLADLVIGGCGTGQGYMNAVLQYPGMSCVLVDEPLDAWLAKRINAPNCISLALNKGYGWAGNVNLELVARALLDDAGEQGYPPERVESQKRSREKLQDISAAAHYTMLEILKGLDDDIVDPVYRCESFGQWIPDAPDSELKDYLLMRIKNVR